MWLENEEWENTTVGEIPKTKEARLVEVQGGGVDIISSSFLSLSPFLFVPSLLSPSLFLVPSGC